MEKIKKPVLIILASLAAAFLVIVLSGTPFHFSMDGGGGSSNNSGKTADDEKIPIKVLILPKFEIGELSGDREGEGQLFYTNLFDKADEYAIPGLGDDTVMYVRDGLALCLGGVGKVDCALKTAAILTDERFDFSDAYIISTGCGGSAQGYSVMGDVIIITGIADYDLGHQADPREMEHPENPTWFHDEIYDGTASLILDKDLTDRVYELTKDIQLDTTDTTREYMKETFGDAEWAKRGPKVIRGTDVTGDDYWKGEYSDRNAKLIAEQYGCPDPFAITDMEEIAVGRVVERLGMKDRYIAIRSSVNMDVFFKGDTPENLWGTGNSITSENSMEALDLFPVSMRNNYKVVSTVVKAIDNGEL